MSNPGEVLWEGTPGYSVAVAFDPTQYSKLIVSFDGNDDETISGPFVATNGAYPSEPTENAELVYLYGAWTIRSYTNYITKIVGYK